MKIKISKNLLLAFLLASTLPLLIGGIIAHSTAKAHEEHRAAVYLEKDVSSLAIRLSVFISVAARNSHNIANAIAYGPKDNATISELLGASLNLNRRFTKCHLLNTQGIILASTDRADIGHSIAEQPEDLRQLFSKASQAKYDEHYLSQPGEGFKRADKDGYERSKDTTTSAARTMAMHLFVPVIDPKGVRIGVLQAVFGAQYILDSLTAQTLITDQDNIFIIDRSNRIIFSLGQKMAAGDMLKLPYLELLESVPAIEPYERKQSQRVTVLDQEFLASVILLPETDPNASQLDWRLIALQPYEEIVRGINSGWQKAIYPLWFLLALIIVGALWLSRSISRPIQLLVRSAKAVAAGNYSTQAQDSNITEVSELASAFNSMAQAVAAHEHSLKTEIAERMRAETQLNELQSRQALILNSAGDGLLGIDASGNLSFVNPAGASMLGFWPEDLVGTKVCALIECSATADTPGPCGNCVMKSDAELDEKQPRKAFFKRDDGQRIAVEYVISPLADKDGKSTGSVLVFRNVSQRKENPEETASELASEKTPLRKVMP